MANPVTLWRRERTTGAVVAKTKHLIVLAEDMGLWQGNTVAQWTQGESAEPGTAHGLLTRTV
jgi:hypothetical protein